MTPQQIPTPLTVEGLLRALEHVDKSKKVVLVDSKGKRYRIIGVSDVNTIDKINNYAGPTMSYTACGWLEMEIKK